MEMDGLYNESNSTYCLNVSEILKLTPHLDLELKVLMIFNAINIPLLLVPTLILQLFFIYRYKSTFLYRQFLYTTIVVILFKIIYALLYPSSLNDGCPLFYLVVTSLYRYMIFVEMLNDNHPSSTLV